MEKTHFEQDKNGHYRVVLYKRGNTPIWQARMKIGKGPKGWKRFSTGETDSVLAGQKACERYREHQLKIKFGLSPDSRTFRHCAKVAEKEMRNALESGTGKVIYEDYIRTIHKYLIPFFQDRLIDTIDRGVLVDFDKFRIEKLGHIPSRSTVANHNATLNRIFNVAVNNRWMNESSVPKLTNTGTKTSKQESRAYFEDEELKEILKFLKKWRGTGRKLITKQIRTILYDYVIIVSYTGIRPGTEADYIRFCDIAKFTNKHGKQYLSIRVCGKTGERVITADLYVKKAIDRLVANHRCYQGVPDEFLNPYESDAYIFEIPCTGELPKDLGRAFTNALTKINLRYDKYGKKRSLYSLRHSYATRVLLRNETNVHLLARHMGTSVAMIEKYYSKVQSVHKADRFVLTDSLETEVPVENREQVIEHLKSISNHQ